MNNTLAYRNLQLNFSEKLISDLSEIAIKAYPNEIGGLLIGKYSADLKSLNVTEFLLPTNYHSSPISFIRNIDSLISKLKALFSVNKHYIGEWHTHPDGSSQYSTTDLNAMINIANTDSVSIENPILLIVALSSNKIEEYTFYHYKEKQLISYV